MSIFFHSYHAAWLNCQVVFKRNIIKVIIFQIFSKKVKIYKNNKNKRIEVEN